MSKRPGGSRQKLAHHVRDHLLETIQGGALAPGDPLPSERELMLALNVGRPAVREAMQSLQGMGLVDIRHGGRARVAEPSLALMVEQISESMRHLLANSPASLEQLKEARLLLEAEMARIAARKRAQSDLDRLDAILAQQAQAQGDRDSFVRLDGVFHREIAALSGNPVFPALASAVFAWLAHFYRGAVSVPGLEKLTLQEHQAILAAIADRDPDAAARCMSDHLGRANELYRKANYPAQG